MPLSPAFIGLLGFILLLVLIFLEMPVGFAFALSGFLGIWAVQGFGPALGDLPVTIWHNISGYILTCLPLFVLMGELAFHSNIGPDLYDTASKWWGRLPGGLALTTVWGSAAFGAVTGVSMAAVVTFTPIAWKPMLDLGYDKRLAAGSIICAGTMASLIPPSTPFILYAAVTNEPISRLFIAGIFPGILQAIMYTALIFFLAGLGIQSGPPGAPSSWKDKIASLTKVWGMAAIFILVIGGIYLGVFTPTEGAAVGTAGTLVIFLFKRGLNLRLIATSIESTLNTTAMVFLILFSSMIFTHFLATSGVSRWLVNVVLAVGLNAYVVLAMAILVLLLAGCVMPGGPMILLFTPLFYPIFVSQYGLNGIWFGVIMVIMSEFAVYTPPVGMHLFVFQALAKKDISTVEIWQGVIPFVIIDAIRVAIMVAFPIISLWLPSLMFQ